MHPHLPRFPDPETADARGLVAITHDLTADMLLAGYYEGLFPWTDDPIGWYSPDPRAVLLPSEVHLPRNLGKLARKAGFTVTHDRAFDAVMEGCAFAHAHEGVWITPRFRRAYGALHAMGHAHSVEVWQDGTLAGGTYGVQIGRVFAGESMFYRVPNASKVAFAALLHHLGQQDVRLIDAQVINENTAKLGAMVVRRGHYLAALRHLRPASLPVEPSPWRA